MRISYVNFIDSVSSGSIVASNENSTYPVTNLQDQRLSVKWQTEDTATTQTVIVDLGATTASSLFAVMSHNLATTGTVTVVGNDSIASGLTWITSGESSTQTITYNANMMLKIVSPISNRYWKFTFSGQTADLSIGRLWIGSYISLTPSSFDNFIVRKRRSDTVSYGKHRQKYASEGVGWRRFELSFPKTASTTVSALTTLYDTVGNHSSFIFMNFDDLRSYELVEPCYVSIDGELAFTHQRNQQYSYDLALEEDL